MGLRQHTQIIFSPISNNFFTNRDRAGIKIPFDVPWVYKLLRKGLMGQALGELKRCPGAGESPPTPMCRGGLSITGWVPQEPGWLSGSERNTGSPPPPEAEVQVFHYPFNKLTEPYLLPPKWWPPFFPTQPLMTLLTQQETCSSCSSSHWHHKAPLSSAPFSAIQDLDLNSPWSSPRRTAVSIFNKDFR